MIIIYFWSSQNGILTVSDLSFDCVQIFSPDIAVSKKLPCFTLPTLNVLYKYTPDILYIVTHLVTSNVCEIMLSLCFVRVSLVNCFLKRCILIYFLTLNLSIIIHVVLIIYSFAFYEKNNPYGHELQLPIKNISLLILGWDQLKREIYKHI